MCTIKAGEHHHLMSTHSSADLTASMRHLSNSLSYIQQSLLTGYDSAWISCLVIPGGGHSHYRGDADVRLQRPPIFSVAVTQ